VKKRGEKITRKMFSHCCLQDAFMLFSFICVTCTCVIICFRYLYISFQELKRLISSFFANFSVV
jgi:hypothetical protein